MKNPVKILIIVVVFLIGISLGRCTQNSPDPVIKYLPGETITDSIPYPEPYEVKITEYVRLPQIIDTLYIDGDTVFVKSVDTVAIVIDYAVLRKYKEILFDNDTIGYLAINSSVQYNKLINLGYKYSPIIKQVSINKESLFTPFVIGTYSTLGYIGVGGGLYMKDFGVQIKYLNNLELNNQGWEFGVIRKF